MSPALRHRLLWRPALLRSTRLRLLDVRLVPGIVQKFSPALVLAVALALLLTGCVGIPAPVDTTLPAGIIRGSVTFADFQPLPADARIEIEIIDTSISGYPANVFASAAFGAGRLRAPVPFQIVYPPESVVQGTTYLLGARVLTEDGLLYTSQVGVPVITNGAPMDNIEVAAEELPVAPAIPGQMNGVITYLTRGALPPDAQVYVQLVDRTTQPFQRVAETVFRTDGAQVPMPFLLQYDPNAIDEARTYALEARIVIDGRLAYLSPGPIPVLTQAAAGDNIEIMMDAAADASVATPTGGVLQASIAYPGEQALPEGALLEVQVRDTESGAIVADTQVDAAGLISPVGVALPLAFIPNELRQYTLTARISNQARNLYLTETEIPVLTQGAPVTNIPMQLVAAPEPTPTPGPTATATPTRVPPTPGGAPTVAVPAPEIGPAIAPLNPSVQITTSTPVTITQPVTPSALLPELDGVLTGQVFYLERIALPDDVTVEVSLDMILEGEPVSIALETFASGGAQVPLPFELVYEPGVIDPALGYRVSARLLDGDEALFASEEGVPVLTNGALASGVDVLVRRVTGDAAEATPEVTPEVTPTPVSTQAPPRPIAGPNEIVVTVRFGNPANAPASAQLRVELRDVTAGAILSEGTIALQTASETGTIFLPYEPSSIVPTNDYFVFVTVFVDGIPIGATGRGYGVLTKGNPNSAQIVLP